MQEKIRAAIESIEIKTDLQNELIQNCKNRVAQQQSLADPPKEKKRFVWLPITAALAASVILYFALLFNAERYQKYSLEFNQSSAPYSVTALSYRQGNISENEIYSEITELEWQSLSVLESHGFLFSLESKDQTVIISCPENSVLVFDSASDFVNGISRAPTTEYALQGGEIIAWISEDSGVIRIYNTNQDKCLQVVSIQKRIWDKNKTTYYASSYSICGMNEIVRSAAYTTDFVFRDDAIEYIVENIRCQENGNQRLYTVTISIQNRIEEPICLYTGNAVLSDLSLLGNIEPTSVFEDDYESSNVVLAPNETKQIRFEYLIDADSKKDLYFSLNTKGMTSTKTETPFWIQYFEVEQ